MTSSQKNEVRLILKALGIALEDVEPGERIDLKGVREEEIILITNLLTREITSPVKALSNTEEE